VLEYRSDPSSAIQVVALSEGVAQRLKRATAAVALPDSLAGGEMDASPLGTGDSVEILILEAPPAALFGGGVLDSRSGSSGVRSFVFPEQVIDSAGTINVPFAGRIVAAGKSLAAIEDEISRLLKGKANQPQVVARLTRNVSSVVTVVGDVANNLRMPLTPRRERLLDAVAAAGGVRQPMNKMTIQVTRGDRVVAVPLESVVMDPRQNVVLRPGDVVSAVFQPLSFTVLGASGRNEEVNFEAKGISLTQALARAGGLQDARSDAQGVFVFRFETPDALEWPNKPVRTTQESLVPVIYTVDLKNPVNFFVAQNFRVRDKDLIYVSNAPAAELQKFLNLVMSIAYPVITVNSLLTN
jgi:polysaccharide export outer membrane protein